MNTNLLHNIMNLVFLIIGAVVAYDWTQLGVSSEKAAVIAGGLMMAQNLLKLLMNVTRDGVTGLVKKQPPVEN